MDISIIIPVFNEAERIIPTLANIRHFFDKNNISFEIITVNDGSTDGTGEILEKNRDTHLKILSNPINKGKGYSVKRGVLESIGKCVLVSDADLSTPIEEYDLLKSFHDKGYKIVIASRALDGSTIILRQSLVREVMGRLFNSVTRILTDIPFKDTQCGFKLYEGNTARLIFSKQVINGFSFDVETVYIAMRMGIKVKEVPVRWKNSLPSRINTLKDGVNMLKELLKIVRLHRDIKQ